jgi:hypothetical protein
MNYAEGVVGASRVLDAPSVSGYEANQVHGMRYM